MTDRDVVLTEIAEHELPFGRRVRLVDLQFASGLRMLRLIWREGTRITQVDIDAENVAGLGDDLTRWAQEAAAQAQD